MNAGAARHLAHGALAGALAWWAMDQTLQAIYDRHREDIRQRESGARGGVPALEVLAERLARLTDVPLARQQRETAGTILQWTMGVGGGMLYTVLREHVPVRGLLPGLVYGTAFWLVVDEGLTPLVGLSPGPAAFPWQTHAREGSSVTSFLAPSPRRR